MQFRDEAANDGSEMDVSKFSDDDFYITVYDAEAQPGENSLCNLTYKQLCELHEYLGELIKEAKK